MVIHIVNAQKNIFSLLHRDQISNHRTIENFLFFYILITLHYILEYLLVYNLLKQMVLCLVFAFFFTIIWFSWYYHYLGWSTLRLHLHHIPFRSTLHFEILLFLKSSDDGKLTCKRSLRVVPFLLWCFILEFREDFVYREDNDGGTA